MKNKTIFITGAYGWISQAFIKKYYEFNSFIAIGKSKKKLLELQKKYPNIAIYVCDISDRNARFECIDFINKNYQNLDVVVNNAWIQNNYYEEDFFWMKWDNFSDIENEIEINFTWLCHFCHWFTLLMIKNRGVIINISSALWIVPKKSSPIYNATKAAVHIFTKTLRYQFENKWVEIYEIIPALVDTNMTKWRWKWKISPDQLVDEFHKNYLSKNYEINISKVKILRILHRFFPKWAEKILKNN